MWINDSPDLSENEKLFYFRGALVGEPKIIETSDDNYTFFFKALEQDYENKRIIVNCHIEKHCQYACN